MNLKRGKIVEGIIFCEVLSILLLVGLSAGFAWGENPVCSSCHHNSMTYLSNIETTYDQSHPDKAFARQHISLASVTDEGVDEMQAGRVRTIRIVLIGTVIGGMLFLGRCL